MTSIHLQMALDVGTTPSLVKLAEQTRDSVDWYEVGTPWILSSGMAAVDALRRAVPDKYIVADMKIMDGGYYEACLGFEAGANLVTVLGCAGDATISKVVRAAREHHGQVMVDLIQVVDLPGRARQVAELGADFIGAHTAFDDQSAENNPIADLAALSGPGFVPVIVAGGINLKTLPEIAAYHPLTVVVGGALTNAPHPAEMARELRKVLVRFEHEG